MSPKQPPKTPPTGTPTVQSDEARALAEIQRRRSRQEHPTPPPPPSPDDFSKEEGTSPVALIDPERWQGDEKYRRDWEATLREFNENAAYRILWERSGRVRRESDQAATRQANAALAVNADASRVDEFSDKLSRIEGELRDVTTVLRITKWILGFVIAATLSSIIVVGTKVFNWGLSTGEVDVRLQTLEREYGALLREREKEQSKP
jgi:hypothetical protein